MNLLSLLDSHAHLTDPSLWDQKDPLLENAKKAHVDYIVNIATDLFSLEKSLSLSSSNPNVATAASTTPHDVEKEGENNFPTFQQAAKAKKLCAIGETGLDYFYLHSSKEKQKAFFIRYLHLAEEYNLPIILHCREAFSDLFEILTSEYTSSLAILHCFSGTMHDAEKALSKGYFLSFSGVITYPKNSSLREVVKETPLHQMLLETDAPYLPPQSYRGKKNEPSYIVETAKEVSRIKNLPLEEIASKTTKNGKKLFFPIS